MTDISSIPLNKLVASPHNARRPSGTHSALQELAASIAAHGCLLSGSVAVVGPVCISPQGCPHVSAGIEWTTPTLARFCGNIPGKRTR